MSIFTLFCFSLSLHRHQPRIRPSTNMAPTKIKTTTCGRDQETKESARRKETATSAPQKNGTRTERKRNATRTRQTRTRTGKATTGTGPMESSTTKKDRRGGETAAAASTGSQTSFQCPGQHQSSHERQQSKKQPCSHQTGETYPLPSVGGGIDGGGQSDQESLP